MRAFLRLLACASSVAFLASAADATLVMTGDGPGTVSTTTLPDGSVQMTYSNDDGFAAYWGESWTLTGIADSTRTVTFSYIDDFYYGWYDAVASISSFSGDTVSEVLWGTPTGPPTYAYTTTINLVEGQAWGFIVSGYDIDGNTDLHGTLTIKELPASVDTPTGSVPEPAAWAMMMLGFGAVGGALRQRKAARVSFG